MFAVEIELVTIFLLVAGILLWQIQSLRPFQRLQWRLTLSYIVVTGVAVITLVTVDAVSEIYQRPQNFIVTMRSRIAQRIAVYLEQQPLNQEALNALSYSFMQSMNEGGHPGSPPPVNLIVVMDQDKHVLSSNSTTGFQMQQFINNPDAQAVILAASTTTDDSQLTRALPDGQTAAAVPLLRYDGRPLGVLFAVVNLSATGTGFVASVINTIWQGALPMTLLGSIFATLFGILTSRGITRRLRRLTHATHDWSQGKFQVEVRDRSHDELGQLARDLNSMAEQLQGLLATREELAVLEERHRLARDLHDVVKQQLFVLSMLIGTTRTQVKGLPQAEQTLTDAERLAGQTHEELNSLIHALRPLAVAHSGLAAALQKLVSDWSRHTGIHTHVHIPDALPVRLAVEQGIFRVVQEALSNVARHSGASQVVLHAVWEDEALLLQLQDNGHGFKPAAQPGSGQGLQNMSERIEHLGGTLLVFSTTGGTRVEARIPLALYIDQERHVETSYQREEIQYGRKA